MSGKQGYIGTFTISLDSSDTEEIMSTIKPGKVSVPSDGPSFLNSEGSSSTTDIAPNSSNIEISDEDILKGIRYVETYEGRKTGGRSGGYSEMRGDTGVYGAYQIMKSVWQPKIKQKFGWDFEDWYSTNPQDADVIKTRQDKIARELLLPEHKKQVKSLNLYETPLGRHLPKGSLEIISQLGPANLKRFLTTGFDRTAFDAKKGGQILGYLQDSLKVLGKELPNSFYSELERMGGVTTKYAKL